MNKIQGPEFFVVEVREDLTYSTARAFPFSIEEEADSVHITALHEIIRISIKRLTGASSSSGRE